MAGKVNSKFVIILSAALILLIGGIAAFYWFGIRKSTSELEALGNYHYQLAEAVEISPKAESEEIADAQEKRSKDYRLAAQSYGKAWNRDPSNVEILLKYIEAYGKMPVEDQFEAEKVRRSIYALTRQATEERPEDSPLLESFYQLLHGWAQEFGYRSLYNDLYTLTTARLETDPDNVVAQKFNGISQAIQLSDAMDRAKQQQVRVLLEDVLTARPDDTDVLHFLSRWHLYDANRLLRVEEDDPGIRLARNKVVEYADLALEAGADDVQVKVEYLLVMLQLAESYRYSAFLAPTDSDEEKEFERLADRLIDDARPVLDNLEAALLIDPSPPTVVKRVAEMLPRIDSEPVETGSMANVTEGLIRTQRLLESAVAERPDMLLYRLMLANVHKLQLNLDEASVAYTAARDHHIRGNYAVSLRDGALRQQAIFEVANLELIRAEAAEDPTERRDILKSADNAVNELETAIDQDPRVLMLRGKIALLRGETTKAMQALDLASDRYNDQDVEALLLSARARQAEKQWGSAASRLEQVLALIKSSPRQDIQGSIRMQLAEMLIRSRKYPEAREQIDFILDSSPKNPVALRMLAEWHSSQDDYAEAITVLEDSGLAEINSSVARKLAELYKSNDQGGRGRTLLLSQFDKNPADLQTLQRLLPLIEGVQEKSELIKRAEASGANPQAISILRLQATGGAGGDGEKISLDQIIEQTQDANATPFEQAMRRAQIYLQYQQIDNARKYFEVAKGIEPSSDRVVLMAMDLAIIDKDFETARRMAADAGNRNLDLAKGHFLRGKLATAEGKLNQALASYDQGLKLRPIFDEGWRQYGDLLLRNNEAEAAVAAYTTALNQKPDSVRALTGLSNAYLAQGLNLQALEALRTAANYAPSDQRLISRYLAFEERYGDADVVLRHRRKLAKSQPKNLQNRAALAMLTAEEGEVREALGMLDGLSDDFGDQLQVAAARAQVMFANDQAKEGEAAVRDYIARRGDEAEVVDYMLLARYLLRTRQVNPAIEAYQQAAALEDPATRPASRALADVLFNFGRNEDVVDLYRELFNSIEDDSQQQIGLRYTETLLNLQRFDEAKAVLDDKRIEQDATADALRGLLFLQQNQPAKAMDFINRSLSKNNQNPRTFLQRAQIYAAKPATQQKALDDLQQALSLQPNLVQAMSLQARVQLNLGRTSEAARTLRSLLERSPGNNQARLQLAQIYAAEGDIEAAEDLINEGLGLNPENPAWLQMSAGLAAQQGNNNAAIRKLETLMDTNPNTQALGQLALLYLDAGKPGAADALLSENAALLGASAGLQSIRGRSLASLGKNDQAQRVFELALQRSQSSRELSDVLRQVILGLGRDEAIQLAENTSGISDGSWVGLVVASILVNERDYDGASARLSTLRNTVPSSNVNAILQIEQLEALIKLQNKDYEGARDAYQRLLKADPGNLAALNNLAYLMSKNLNDPRGALPFAKKAAELAPDNAAVLDTLGWTYYQTNQIREAREALENSVRAQALPANTQHLARIYAEDGDTERARTLLEQSIELADQVGNTDIAAESREFLKDLTR